MTIMLRAITALFVALGVAGVVAVVSSPEVSAAFDPLQKVCQLPGGGTQPANSPACKDSAGTPENPLIGMNGLIIRVSTIIAVVAGIVAVIMVIIGAAGLITSGGDSNKAKAARLRIIHSLIGLVIIALAQGLVIFVVGALLK